METQLCMLQLNLMYTVILGIAVLLTKFTSRLNYRVSCETVYRSKSKDTLIEIISVFYLCKFYGEVPIHITRNLPAKKRRFPNGKGYMPIMTI